MNNWWISVGQFEIFGFLFVVRRKFWKIFGDRRGIFEFHRNFQNRPKSFLGEAFEYSLYSCQFNIVFFPAHTFFIYFSCPLPRVFLIFSCAHTFFIYFSCPHTQIMHRQFITFFLWYKYSPQRKAKNIKISPMKKNATSRDSNRCIFRKT